MTKHVYLTKVLVQTVWVVVDDETGIATEQADTGVSVSAAEWPEFYSNHKREFDAMKEMISNAESEEVQKE